MTDFLTRLAARSLGQAPVVLPRLLSRFETASTIAEPIELTSPIHAPAGEHRVSSERDLPVADQRGRGGGPDDHQPPRPQFAQPPRHAFPADQNRVVIARKVVGMTDRSADPAPLRADHTGSPKSDRSVRPTDMMTPRAMAVKPTAAADHAPAPHLSRDRAAVEASVADRVDLTRPTPAAPVLPDPHLAVVQVGSGQTVLPTTVVEKISDRALRPDARLAVAHVGSDQTAVFSAGVVENISGPALRPDPRLAVVRVGSDQTAVFPTRVMNDISARTPPLLPDPSSAIAHVGPNKPTALLRAAEGMNARTAPVVRVSIGRIEVRAVTAPAAAPLPRATPRVAGPSLEEYLKERSGVP